MDELHWITFWVSFPKLRVSGIVFTSTKSTSLVVAILLGHYLRTYMRLSRVTEPSRFPVFQFVYIVSHVALHVKSNAEKVNCLHVCHFLYIYLNN